MHCSGCGKTIPFAGTVCPYCHRDKSQDQRYTLLAVVLGGAGAYIGWEVGGFWGAVAGFVGGALVAAIAMNVGKAPKPPEVQVVATAAGGDDLAERLRRLKDLQAQGLISEEEAADRRRQITAEI